MNGKPLFICCWAQFTAWVAASAATRTCGVRRRRRWSWRRAHVRRASISARARARRRPARPLPSARTLSSSYLRRASGSRCARIHFVCCCTIYIYTNCTDTFTFDSFCLFLAARSVFHVYFVFWTSRASQDVRTGLINIQNMSGSCIVVPMPPIYSVSRELKTAGQLGENMLFCSARFKFIRVYEHSEIYELVRSFPISPIPYFHDLFLILYFTCAVRYHSTHSRCCKSCLSSMID